MVVEIIPEASKKKIKSIDLPSYSEMRCPMQGLVNLLAGPWTMFILWLIRVNGPLRFGQLRQKMPKISAKVLTERLRMLEELDILYREHEATSIPKVTYGFTVRGEELNTVLDDINKIALAWTSTDAIETTSSDNTTILNNCD